ncbi:YlmC/YmxH family sporulation protein [Bacillus sp. TBS-096]|nr:YlmC/YmxH family sporulation protein [Bacillus sp. TBS-096]MDH6562479.1 YlmC/YmxH family sporulation protein [Bacillus sp. TBS-096]
MRLSELSGKEIVDIKRAERLGVLGQTDLEINEQDGQITALIIPSVKWFGFRKQGNDIRVPWNHIQKIGSDMIILDVPEELQLHGEKRAPAIMGALFLFSL